MSGRKEMFNLHFATRLNSFLTHPELYIDAGKKLSPKDLILRAGAARGLTHVDINFPDHIRPGEAQLFNQYITQAGLQLNGLAMRYYKLPEFFEGALSHPQKRIRQQAIDLTLKGIETLRQMNGKMLTIWLSQEGQEYPFQIDFSRQYQHLVESLQLITAACPEVKISIEYKASEPRGISTISTAAATLLLIQDIGAKNLGVTIDFCHSLMAREQPAAAAALVFDKSELLGIHLNDGYGYKDDGLMVGSVHTLHTLELLWILKKNNFKGVVYFDTFATYQDPVEECEKNIQMTQALLGKINKLDSNFQKTLNYSSWQDLLK